MGGWGQLSSCVSTDVRSNTAQSTDLSALNGVTMVGNTPSGSGSTLVRAFFAALMLAKVMEVGKLTSHSKMLLQLLLCLSRADAVVLDVERYGAKADNATVNTVAFRGACFDQQFIINNSSHCASCCSRCLRHGLLQHNVDDHVCGSTRCNGNGCSRRQQRAVRNIFLISLLFFSSYPPPGFTLHTSVYLLTATTLGAMHFNMPLNGLFKVRCDSTSSQLWGVEGCRCCNPAPGVDHDATRHARRAPDRRGYH